MSKVLITGEEGYMAKCFVAPFKNRGWEIAKKPEDMVKLYKSEYNKPEVDASHYPSMLHWLQTEKPDVVVHCAALVGSERGNYMKTASVESNLSTTIAVSSACNSFNIPLCYISSSAVYAEWAPKPLLETSPLEPLNYYNVTKLAGELLVRGQSMVPWFVIRPAMGFGNHLPILTGYPHSTMDKLILTKIGRWEETFKIMLDRMYRKPYVLMSEMCEVMTQLIVKFPIEKIVNVASPHAPKFGELLDVLGFDVNDLPEHIFHEPQQDFLKDHTFHPWVLNEMLGYEWNPTPAIDYLKKVIV